VGVGSAIRVFVRERLRSVAVLRCLGASQNSVFAVYLLQAAALGLEQSVGLGGRRSFTAGSSPRWPPNRKSMLGLSVNRDQCRKRESGVSPRK